MPNKITPAKISLYDLYLADFKLTKASDIDIPKAMYEYVGESLDYVALYDNELQKGFALSNLSESNTDISIIYLHDVDGETVKEEELIWGLLSGKILTEVREALIQTHVAANDMTLVYVDGFTDYEGSVVTKLLPMRKHFSL